MSSEVVSRATVRSVAVPVEHGGWAFLFQPIALGLLVAPSWAGLALAIAALFVFLMHQPLKIALGDWRRGKVYPRTHLAWRFVAGYGLAAGVAAALAVLGGRPLFWLPLAAGVSFALLQLAMDARKQSREAVAEAAGALALGSLAPALAVLGGWDVARAWPLWPLLACQAVPAILYARARLRLERSQSIRPQAVWLAHGIGLVVAGVLAGAGAGPWLAVAGMAIMLARAVHGLSRWRRPSRASQVGVQEVVFSVLYVLLTAIGLALAH